MKVAIIAVGYNRPKSLGRLLASLARAQYDGAEVMLIISIDKADNREVEKMAREFVWPFGPKLAAVQSERLGLRKHILQCGQYTAQFDAVIVLEDDLFVSPLFYRFAIQALQKYDETPEIAGISLYSHLWNVHCARPFLPEDDGTDAYFMQLAQSWGQVWSRRMWNEFYSWYLDHAAEGCAGENIPDYVKGWPESSWLKYQIAYIIEQGKYFVYPRVSLTTNFGDIGQHAGEPMTVFQVPLLGGDKKQFVFPPFQDQAVIYDAFFERRGLGEHLSLPDRELCVDIYGTKANRAGRRYWLTMERRSYEVRASYGLRMRPHETNVKLGISGHDIYLYDTKGPAAAPSPPGQARVALTKTRYDTRAISRNDLLGITCFHLVGAVKRMWKRTLRFQR